VKATPEVSGGFWLIWGVVVGLIGGFDRCVRSGLVCGELYS
jgi:hypothetical protein